MDEHIYLGQQKGDVAHLLLRSGSSSFLGVQGRLAIQNNAVIFGDEVHSRLSYIVEGRVDTGRVAALVDQQCSEVGDAVFCQTDSIAKRHDRSYGRIKARKPDFMSRTQRDTQRRNQGRSEVTCFGTKQQLT